MSNTVYFFATVGVIATLIAILVLGSLIIEYFCDKKKKKAQVSELSPEELVSLLKKETGAILDSYVRDDTRMQAFLTILRTLVTDTLPGYTIEEANAKDNTCILRLRHNEYPPVTITTTLDTRDDPMNPATYSVVVARLAEYKRDHPESSNALLLPQLTNKCDQQCAHCCFNCGPNNNEFMDTSTIQAAVHLLKSHPYTHITLGGGEPTLHPDLVGVAKNLLVVIPRTPIYVITNGTGDFRRLSALIKVALTTDYLGVEVSQDAFHTPIPPKVMALINGVTNPRVLIRPHTWRYARPYGRGATIADPTNYLPCICDAHTVAPDGTLFPCSCGLSWPEKPTVSLNVKDLVDDPWLTEYMQKGRICCQTPGSYEDFVRDIPLMRG